MTNFKRLAMIALFAILATACTTQQPIKSSEPKTPGPVNTSASIKQLLVEAETATPLKAAQLKVQAARLMLLQEKFTAVTRLLDTIAVQALPDSLLFKAYLVRAKASIGLAEGNSALLYLTKLTNDSGFSDAQLNDKYTTLASAYGLTNQLNKEVVALISASEFTNDSSELISLNENIWQLFKTLDLQQLKTIGTNANNSYTLRGWLVLIIKFKETPNSEKIIANQWYKSWTAHSAVKFPPQALAGYLSKEPLQNTSYNYSHVVVALPESGKYAKGGAAIIQGIKLAAMSPANNNVQISYIDSARYNSASAILARAQELNADAIIGPINRAIVSQLAQMPALPIPVLALNTTAIGNSNLYQFGLSNEDEVRDAAQRAFKDGRRNILALVPENDSGILAANTFTNAFNSLGGQVLSTSYYDTDKGNVTNAVAQMLKLNQSTIRALQKKVKTAFLRDAIRRMTRKDADGIFLFASKSDAYQIGPSILYFYADNLPLYATSRIFSGKTNPVKDLDLNGMMFGDIPWLLTEGNYKRKMAAVTGKTQTRFGRLYAFGIDALNVAPNLYNLAAQPDSFYDGETGKLKVSADNMLQKTLNWAQFVDGSLKTLPAQ